MKYKVWRQKINLIPCRRKKKKWAVAVNFACCALKQIYKWWGVSKTSYKFMWSQLNCFFCFFFLEKCKYFDHNKVTASWLEDTLIFNYPALMVKKDGIRSIKCKFSDASIRKHYQMTPWRLPQCVVTWDFQNNNFRQTKDDESFQKHYLIDFVTSVTTKWH